MVLCELVFIEWETHQRKTCFSTWFSWCIAYCWIVAVVSTVTTKQKVAGIGFNIQLWIRFNLDDDNDKCNLVDPASSHMLVSEIKPCKSEFKIFWTKLRMAHYNSDNLCENKNYTDNCGNSGAKTWTFSEVLRIGFKPSSLATFVDPQCCD